MLSANSCVFASEKQHLTKEMVTLDLFMQGETIQLIEEYRNSILRDYAFQATLGTLFKLDQMKHYSCYTQIPRKAKCTI